MNKLLVFVSCLYLVLAPTYTYATPPKWVQDYIKTEQYNQQLKEKAKVTSSNGNITSSVSNSGTSSSGTAVKTTAVLTKKASSGSVAAQIAKRYGKAIGVSAAGAFLGSAALQLLIEGIGWAMGEGGKITKPNSDSCNSDGSTCTHAQYIFKVDISTKSGVYNYKYFPDLISAGVALCLRNKASNNSWDCSSVTKFPNSINTVTIATDFGYVGKFLIDYKINPNFVDNSSNNQNVTTEQISDAIKSYIDSNPNSQIANDLNAAAYSHDAANDDSSSLASENANAMQSSLNNAATSPSGTASNTSTDKAGNPQNVTSTVKSGAEATGEATTTNPDGSTSDSSMSMQLPAFCDWASAVCEWFDWTKETPDDITETDQPDIDDQGIFTRKFDTVFSLSKDCPADIPFNLDTQYLKVSNTISLKWLCIIFTALGYPLVFASNCIGIWILYEAVIRRQKAG